MNRCIGVNEEKETGNRISCTRYSKDGSEYCRSHQYFENLSDEEIAKLKAGEGKKCRAKNCNKLNLGTTYKCQYCLDRDLKDKREKNILKKKCDAIMSTEEPPKCLRNALSDGQYCNGHSYQADYTEEQKKNLKSCSKCHKAKYLFDCNGNPVMRCNTCSDVDGNRKEESMQVRTLNANGELYCNGCRKHHSVSEFKNVDAKSCMVYREKQRKREQRAGKA